MCSSGSQILPGCEFLRVAMKNRSDFFNTDKNEIESFEVPSLKANLASGDYICQEHLVFLGTSKCQAEFFHLLPIILHRLHHGEAQGIYENLETDLLNFWPSPLVHVKACPVVQLPSERLTAFYFGLLDLYGNYFQGLLKTSWHNRITLAMLRASKTIEGEVSPKLLIVY